MKLWIITGSATESGAPIYLQSSGRWTHKLSAGHPISSEDERQSLLEAARGQQKLVCDPYWIEVRRAELGHLAPVSLREKIRAEGPTISLRPVPQQLVATASRTAAASA
ncbi:hypothetical protein DB30_01917 [Enhygromyxa salina]|uniref:DUF2849 domain-containing protein n=1 Tax=Enhygromyxa salina TaxID=215803 RepID=A0A0C2D8T0_9BACT|nr:DUF2849 domain-containing protein [Enhygromyxa salina]KIG18030.1 hypothetical protein DB30_01917 [Enhygromyxa salina]